MSFVPNPPLKHYTVESTDLGPLTTSLVSFSGTEQDHQNFEKLFLKRLKELGEFLQTKDDKVRKDFIQSTDLNEIDFGSRWANFWIHHFPCICFDSWIAKKVKKVANGLLAKIAQYQEQQQTESSKNPGYDCSTVRFQGNPLERTSASAFSLEPPTFAAEQPSATPEQVTDVRTFLRGLTTTNQEVKEILQDCTQQALVKRVTFDLIEESAKGSLTEEAVRTKFITYLKIVRRASDELSECSYEALKEKAEGKIDEENTITLMRRASEESAHELP